LTSSTTRLLQYREMDTKASCSADEKLDIWNPHFDLESPETEYSVQHVFHVLDDQLIRQKAPWDISHDSHLLLKAVLHFARERPAYG
jgi:hypothetical protein